MPRRPRYPHRLSPLRSSSSNITITTISSSNRASRRLEARLPRPTRLPATTQRHPHSSQRLRSARRAPQRPQSRSSEQLALPVERPSAGAMVNSQSAGPAPLEVRLRRRVNANTWLPRGAVRASRAGLVKRQSRSRPRRRGRSSLRQRLVER